MQFFMLLVLFKILSVTNCLEYPYEPMVMEFQRWHHYFKVVIDIPPLSKEGLGGENHFPFFPIFLMKIVVNHDHWAKGSSKLSHWFDSQIDQKGGTVLFQESARS
eukprot:TRINITY_DN20518_c0_g1_i1.p1 TRINITY_DN20518_c0_g1~~TRINITY_DN20518_c0_g1_i1.p1  ORF type:complete len:105 (-),score=11.57 TRINITY_DN20518_c0_g1_i1:152-466(-)